MAKQAIFLLTSSGVDGRGKKSISFAFLTEEERTAKRKELGNNAGYYSDEETVVDLEEHGEKVVKQLDGLDKLALTMRVVGEPDQEPIQDLEPVRFEISTRLAAGTNTKQLTQRIADVVRTLSNPVREDEGILAVNNVRQL